MEKYWIFMYLQRSPYHNASSTTLQVSNFTTPVCRVYLDADDWKPTLQHSFRKLKSKTVKRVPFNRKFLSSMIFIIACSRLTMELFQLCRNLVVYLFDFTNMFEVCFYVLTIVFVSDFESEPIKQDWRWKVGAVSIWLSWMVLILFLQKGTVQTYSV